MKKIIIVFTMTILTSSAFATATEVRKLGNIDTEIMCRPIKENNFFRSFFLRLRNTDLGLRLVKNSVDALPEFTEIKTLELQPQINVTTAQKTFPGFPHPYNTTKITILSGDALAERSAALEINIDPIEGTTGRLQEWWPGQTSSLTERLDCFSHDVYSNSQPVIP